jgi:hypothetical protein
MKNNQESKDNKIGSTSFDPKKRCLLDAHWRLLKEIYNTYVNANSGDKDIIKRND